jgi:hypothetical protein
MRGHTFTSFIQLFVMYWKFVRDRLGVLTLVLSWIFINVRSFGHKLRLDKIYNKIFELFRSCRHSYTFIFYLIATLLNFIILIFFRFVIAFWFLSLSVSKRYFILCISWWLKIKPHIHIVGINRKVIFFLMI